MSPVARSNKLLFCAASSIGRQLAQFIKSQNKANCARSSIGFRGLHTLKSPTLVERSDPSLAGLVSASMDLGELICKQTDLTLEMTKRVMVEEAKESNLVYSPLSMNVVLSLIAAGSSGRTLDQLVSFLGSKSNKDLNSFASQVVSLVLADGSASGGPRLSFANSVWIDKSLPIKPSFSEVVQNVYKATAKQVDFQTKAVEVANEVNSWAENETRGLIKEVLPTGSVDKLTELILANALYFKGTWDEKFDSSETKEYDFHLLDGSSVQVPFMTSEKKQYVAAFDGFKVLRLLYKQDNRDFSMYFYLPDAKDGLQALVDKMASKPGFLDWHLPQQKFNVDEFRIPKFKISFGFEASDVLKGLGVVLPFSAEGLTEMVDSPLGKSLFVSCIFHKSFIEVDEEGTKAAAASVAIGRGCCLSLPMTMDFVADHPFVFLIREGITGAVLFTGHVLNPAQVA